MVTFDVNQIGFACLGGLLLGIATSFNYIVRGKVTGMSGIAYGIISVNKCTRLLMQPSYLKNSPSLAECSSFLRYFISSTAMASTEGSNLSVPKIKSINGQHIQGSFYQAFWLASEQNSAMGAQVAMAYADYLASVFDLWWPCARF